MNNVDLKNERNRIPFRLLRLHADAIGDSPFLLSDERSYSYGQANAVVNAYAHGLRRLGLQAGDRLMLYMHSCVEFVLLSLAANKLGALWVPVNTDYRGEWLSDTINASKGAVLVTDTDLLEKLRPVERELRYERLVLRGGAEAAGGEFAQRGIVSLDELADNSEAEPETKHIGYGDAAAVLWTSGTTGKPKGVLQSHNVWIRAAVNNDRLYGTRPGDITYNCLPLYNSAAWVANIYRALTTGIPCALDEQFSVSKFWDRIRFYGATQTMTLGAMHMFLWNEPRKADDADNPLRVASMVPMPHKLIAPFCERFGLEAIVQGFGQSEVMPILTKAESAEKQFKPNALGKLFEDMELKLLRDDGQEAGPGEPGEFTIRPLAPHIIFSGYFDDPEATKKAFRGEWYGTGDLGMRDAEGDYFFVDRKKDYIRYKGRNISSLQVEGIAASHPAVQAAAVYGLPSDTLESEHEIKLDVILKPGQQLRPEELAGYINERAPYFCVPRYIDFVDELPYTPTQKLEKYKLRAKGLSASTWDRLKSDFKLQR
ncbi:crotonobetaine/carnitine-CoA ligase [Steroidobacter denitrificans]|uniref:Crotonobetaine/carnitine-CoA ligase n=1 Tax=Steroidobacter denitrificans TaxID=465721 RepID=A0A127F6U0_STEDE|nr:AMP-binding protein [Steroidobacter denitrificans]AMN46166.1 crotonobetaine/carnitine-CoA ligase [Steroidobacter denitrificans]